MKLEFLVVASFSFFFGVVGTLFWLTKHLPDDIGNFIQWSGKIERSYYLHNMQLKPDSDCECGNFGKEAQVCFAEIKRLKNQP